MHLSPFTVLLIISTAVMGMPLYRQSNERPTDDPQAQRRVEGLKTSVVLHDRSTGPVEARSVTEYFSELSRRQLGGGAAKKVLKQAISATNAFKAAGQAHRNNKNMPNRDAIFKVPSGGSKPEQTMTGKDVRTGMFAGKVAGDSKKFNNYPHIDPKSQMNPQGSTKPVQNMKGPGRESTMSTSTDPKQRKQDHRTTPSRIITQPNSSGGQDFQAVVAHDQSRGKGDKGKNDHFEVSPQPPAPPRSGGVAEAIKNHEKLAKDLQK
jgi:hypothetical protein